jgi:hypothetical protein
MKIDYKTLDFIEKVRNRQLQREDFSKELLEKVNTAINSGQIPEGNKLNSLLEMQKILNPKTK